jgi:exo-beta-1,3-glucanase (GH17 family)
MAKGRFVTYQPTAIKVVNGKLTQASDASLRADLKVLRPHFDSLITYGAQGGAERIPDIAAELGYRAVVMGIWDFYNEAERANAIAAARRRPKIVAGLSLGNEMILARRAAWGDLEYMLGVIRAQLPGVPLTVTETFAEFLDSPDARPVLARMDFLMANIHPIFESWFRTTRAPNWADFVVRVTDLLARIFPGPVLVKETGIPTAPAALGFTPAMQHDFYRALEKRFPQTARRAFSYFSAFDAPWRASDVIVGGGYHPEEAHWGLFDANRAPKAVMRDFPALPPPTPR